MQYPTLNRSECSANLISSRRCVEGAMHLLLILNTSQRWQHSLQSCSPSNALPLISMPSFHFTLHRLPLLARSHPRTYLRHLISCRVWCSVLLAPRNLFSTPLLTASLHVSPGSSHTSPSALRPASMSFRLFLPSSGG